MYLYYSIHTKDESITWETRKIEKFIDKTKMFLKEVEGCYGGIDFFCLLGLMKVKKWDSWSNKDYNCWETNYISIITSEDNNRKIPKQSMEIMKKLSELLKEDIFLED